MLSKLKTVDGAGSGLDADALDGLSTEPWRVVGGAGQPAFTNGWVDYGFGGSSVAFTKDATGVVHIRGQVKNGNVAPIPQGAAFTLPAGYRPDGDRYFPALTTNGNNVITDGYVAVDAAGNVIVAVGNNTFVALNFSFRP